MGELENVNWRGLVQRVERGFKARGFEVNHGMSVIPITAKMQSEIASGVFRVRRFYRGTVLNWVGVRGRRGGGLTMRFGPIILNNETLHSVEVTIADAGEIFGPDAVNEAFKTFTNSSLDELLALYRTDVNSSSAPVEVERSSRSREELIPDCGSWS